MADNNRAINVVFGCVVFFLAAVAAASMYQNRNLPLVRDAAPRSPTGVGLPENHPPIDSTGKLAALEQLSRENPQNADYRAQIGHFFYDSGEYQKAIDAYRESLRLRPQDASVETDMATCYHYLGQDDQALEILDRVLQYRPDFPVAMLNKGIVLQVGKKDAAGAIAIWERLERVLQLNPTLPERSELERKIRQLKAEVK